MMKYGVGTYEATPRTRHYVSKVLESGRISYGPLCKQLEDDFAEIHGVKYAISCASGTDALRLALHALKIKHKWVEYESEVILPAVTFVATLNVVRQLNLIPVLVDVESYFYNIDPWRLEEKINGKTVCVMPVHLFGQPANVKAIKRNISANIKIVEDSCETMFATHHGEHVGSLGDLGCFSFYMAHLVTAGTGGMVTTDDDELATIVRSLANHGRDTAYWNIDMANDSIDALRNRFVFVYPDGYSTRMTELQAALALPQLEDWQYMISVRNKNAALLTKRLSKHRSLILPTTASFNSHSFMMYPIIFDSDTRSWADKWGLIKYLEEYGVETREMLPLINQPAYKDMYKARDFRVATWINNRGFYIGCHQDLLEEDIHAMADVFDNYFAEFPF